MANIYKVSFYAIDINDVFNSGKHFLHNLMKTVKQDCLVRQEHVKQSLPFSTKGESCVYDENCDLSELEKHFNHNICIDILENQKCYPKVGCTYRHFKGHEVKVLAISQGTQYREWVVVYEHLGDHRVWHRPLNMFMSKVDKDKYPDVEQEYRFERIGE